MIRKYLTLEEALELDLDYLFDSDPMLILEAAELMQRELKGKNNEG